MFFKKSFGVFFHKQGLFKIEINIKLLSLLYLSGNQECDFSRFFFLKGKKTPQN